MIDLSWEVQGRLKMLDRHSKHVAYEYRIQSLEKSGNRSYLKSFMVPVYVRIVLHDIPGVA